MSLKSRLHDLERRTKDMKQGSYFCKCKGLHALLNEDRRKFHYWEALRYRCLKRELGEEGYLSRLKLDSIKYQGLSTLKAQVERLIISLERENSSE